MLILLPIASLFVIIHGVNNCPAGTRQIGDDGAIINYYQSGQQQRLGLTADDCKAYCASMGPYRCRSFSFDATPYSNSGGVQPALCKTYSTNIQSGSVSSNPYHPNSDQVLCRLDDTVDVACPAGTSQVGGHGSWLMTYTMGYYSGISIDQCKLFCSYRGGSCGAFTFDSDNGAEDASSSFCRLQPYNAGIQRGTIPPGNVNYDQVVCALGTSSAQAPGLFDLDGNGETETMQLSVYIMYFVIGLVLVNIICLSINCWKKCNKGRSNKNKYKVVSMRSDQDTDIECQ